MRLNINPILNTLGEEGMTAHLHNNYCSRAKEKSTNKPYSSHSHVYIHISGNSNGNMILMCRMSLEGHACGDSMRRCVRGGARDRFLVMLPRPGMKTVLVSLVSLNTNPSLTTKMRDEGKRKSERTITIVRVGGRCSYGVDRDYRCQHRGKTHKGICITLCTLTFVAVGIER